ncbi:protein lifeguard 1-like [Dreissena polymorpha]|uniref:protein lifeguard 1-like n=1 Tax=Dreissena polymorpha TaxID=45954 RepID=UPI0022652732|nr:protein lifeguard 1-like [Dreissena polymorpha]XP_052253428.1 protein lifeguard 1-like [Dreissena polymorpha]XP_052253429.1 protein lifeguard 1-like [Dreissena polymorpha]XP_052253430.1 protein lifeguard 1-like [Dreissena polymorpha]XP_052253431.1 protein lifeguard 1-like [Dreissena polymorpha]
MYDEERSHFANDDFSGFSEKEVRHGFIRKVYGILMAQLVITFAIMCIFIYSEPVKEFVHDPKNVWLMIVVMVATFVVLIALACCPNVRRSFPTNMILLTVFTVLEGFMLGVVSGKYKTEYVLMAVGITAVVTLSLTIFAFQTKWDFTMMGGLLFVLLIVLFCFGILCAIFRSDIANIVYSCLGALLFSAYLVFDTQMMMGGKHQYAISPEEYIFAALNLYLDIINLFLFILAIFGKKD